MVSTSKSFRLTNIFIFEGDGSTYNVQWAEQYSGPTGAGYTGNVIGSVFKSDGDYYNSSWTQKSSGWSVTGTLYDITATGTVYLKFQAAKAGTIGFLVFKKSGAPAAATTYTVSQNGSSTAATTQLTFAFSASVSGLAASDITITAGTGAATKGTPSGSGTSWTLPVTGVSAGTITVTIAKTGIETAEKTVTLFGAPATGGGVKDDPTTSPSGISGKTITLTINSANTALVSTKKVYVVVYMASAPNTPVAWGKVDSTGTTGTGAIKLANWDNTTVWTGSGSVYYRVLIGDDANKNYTQCAYYTYQPSGSTEATLSAGTATSMVFNGNWKLGTGNPPGMPGF